MWKLMTLACTALIAVSTAHAQDAPGQAFASSATSAGLAAIALGEMADARSTHVGVQTLGRDLARDHAALNAEIAGLADAKGLSLPDDGSAGAEQRGNALDSLRGEEFDRRLLEAVVADHAAAIALFEREASAGADVDLRELAQRTLPVLRGHLATAKALQATSR